MESKATSKALDKAKAAKDAVMGAVRSCCTCHCIRPAESCIVFDGPEPGDKPTEHVEPEYAVV